MHLWYIFYVKGDGVFYFQHVCIFNHEKHCRNVLPRDDPLIYNLQDLLNHFIILILLGS